MSNLRFVVAASCLFALGWADPVEGCTVEIAKHRSVFRGASAVFLGTVIDVTSVEGGGSLARFRVGRRWKGPKTHEISVLADHVGACWPLRFETGRTYLIYASVLDGGTGILQIPPASRSRQVDSRDAEPFREIRDLDSRWFRFRSRFPF
jgi:hypothetical protein